MQPRRASCQSAWVSQLTDPVSKPGKALQQCNCITVNHPTQYWDHNWLKISPRRSQQQQSCFWTILRTEPNQQPFHSSTLSPLEPCIHTWQRSITLTDLGNRTHCGAPAVVPSCWTASFVQKLLWKPVRRSLELSPVAGWRIKYQFSETARVKSGATTTSLLLVSKVSAAWHLQVWTMDTDKDFKTAQSYSTGPDTKLREVCRHLPPPPSSSQVQWDVPGGVHAPFWNSMTSHQPNFKILNFLGGRHFKGEKCSVKC